jgi:PqqD family protein of HPr-rel-A system
MPVILRPSARILRERRWDEECVVFDTYSAETHYLNPLASAIFHRVAADRAINLDDLCASLIGHGPEDTAPALAPEEIGAAAGRLRDIGLLRIDDSGG